MSQAGKIFSTSGGSSFVNTLTGNSGGAVPPTGGNIDIEGDGIVTVTGNPGTSTLTISLDGTPDALAVYDATGELNEVGPLNDGQILIGDTGGAPVVGSITSTGGTISVSLGAGTINLESSGTTILDYTNVNTSPYVVLTTDTYLSVDCSVIPIVLEFPNAATSGRSWIVKDRTGSANAQNITLTTVGGVVNIDGSPTYIMNTQYAATSIIGNGSTYELY